MGGFKVWLLKGCGPNLSFLRRSSKVPDFQGENPATCHLTFTMDIRHHFALGDMDYDNHIRRGEQVYIYTSCTMQAHRAGK